MQLKLRIRGCMGVFFLGVICAVVGLLFCDLSVLILRL